MSEALKSEVFFASDYGPLGKVVITLPANNGDDEQFDADFEATMQFVKGVMDRRKASRIAAPQIEGGAL